MTTELELRLNKLKEYNLKKSIQEINNLIYSGKLTDTFLSNIPDDLLLYIHVKLHTVNSYHNYPIKFKIIKEMHELIVKKLNKHYKIDKLDD